VIVAIDGGVILAAVGGPEDASRRATRALEQTARKATALAICAPVYAALLAFPKWTQADLDAFIAETKIRVDWSLPQEIWSDAGRALAAYSRRRSHKRELADFVVGAHARSVGSLLTDDAAFYRASYPNLKIIAVER
jgi:predicted nucleic acid-binding protein